MNLIQDLQVKYNMQNNNLQNGHMNLLSIAPQRISHQTANNIPAKNYID